MNRSDVLHRFYLHNQMIIRLFRKFGLLEKIALFEQIVLKILRAYAYIRSKNFTKKMPKMAVLASQ
ncbi:MAG: hypothetical protein ACH350_03755 [Parachlamydiaceae bacterium]